MKKRKRKLPQKKFEENKSKKYTRKNFRKNYLNPTEASKFLGCTIEQLIEMVQGKKGYPKLDYRYERKDNSWRFCKSLLFDYRRNLDDARRRGKPY